MLGLPMPAARHTTRLTLVSALTAMLAVLLLAPSAEARRSSRLDRQESTIVRLINGVRSNSGLPRLKVSPRLNRAANGHSWDMIVANYFAHESRDGASSATRVRRYKNARRVGEVLAYVPRSQRKGAGWRVFQMWMNSPSHRAVILTRGFRRIGVARQRGNGRIVFTADFTSRR